METKKAVKRASDKQRVYFVSETLPEIVTFWMNLRQDDGDATCDLHKNSWHEKAVIPEREKCWTNLRCFEGIKR